jgi:hypothetical protein
MATATTAIDLTGDKEGLGYPAEPFFCRFRRRQGQFWIPWVSLNTDRYFVISIIIV